MTLPPRNYTPNRKGRDHALRSPVHRKFVASHLCVCHKEGACQGPIDCCHARDVAPRSGGKPSDVFCFSACRKHHNESEKREHAFGLEHGIDILLLCLEFAAASPDKTVKTEVARMIDEMKARKVAAE